MEGRAYVFQDCLKDKVGTMSLLGKIADKKRLELIEEEIFEPNFQKFVKAIIPIKLKILDLGCGDGWLVKELNKHNFIEAMGIDPNLKEEAKDLLRISTHAFPDNYFDYIVAIEVIEHLEPKMYEEIRRILKPNGKLIVTSPKPKWNWVVEFLCWIGLADPLITPHMNVVNPEDLPFKIIKKQDYLLIEWFGVFENEK